MKARFTDFYAPAGEITAILPLPRSNSIQD